MKSNEYSQFQQEQKELIENEKLDSYWNALTRIRENTREIFSLITEVQNTQNKIEKLLSEIAKLSTDWSMEYDVEKEK